MTKVTLTLRGTSGGEVVFSGSAGMFRFSSDRTSELAQLVRHSGVQIREGWMSRSDDGTVTASMVAEDLTRDAGHWPLVSVALQAVAQQAIA